MTGNGPGGRVPASSGERLELVREALEALRAAVDEDGVPALVEGDKDEAALRALGVTGKIVKVHSGQGLFAFVEALAREHAEAVLLVDWDAAGGGLARRLREACRANGVRLDDGHRLAFMRATRGEVRTVESLDTYVRNLEAAVGTPAIDEGVDALRRAAREGERDDRAR